MSNNIILGATTYRGRPVTESNMQSVLSEVISKYLPANLPPWQITVVPVQKQNESFTTILFRIHHLLLTDQPGVKISDILMIDKMYRVEEEEKDETDSVSKVNYDRSPFNNVNSEAKSLSDVSSRISNRIANQWIESRYEVLMKSSNEQGPESVWELINVATITVVTIGQKFIKNVAGVENKFYLNFLWQLFQKEFKRNNLNISAIKQCFYNTISNLNPITLLRNFLSYQISLFKWICFELPIFYINEIRDLVLWLRNGCSDQYPDTVIGYFVINCPIFYRAGMELFRFLLTILEGPRRLWDMLTNTPDEINTLQEVGSSGRKIIAWSNKIPLERIERLVDQDNSDQEELPGNQTDLILTWLAASIKECLESFNSSVPESVQVSARCVYQECLLGNMIRANGGIDGIFCFNLPLGGGNQRHLIKMRRRLKEARDSNVTLYSLTRNEQRQCFLAEVLSPHWIKLMANYLSRKYCITITDIVTKRRESFSAEQKNGHRTLWGAEVLEFDYFRPPVANTKLSITIQRYRNYVRIGVLADAELSPGHQKIINAWPEFIEQYEMAK